MNINKASTIDDLMDLAQDELNITNFRADLLDDLLRRAYSLGYRAGQECDEDIF